VVLIERRSSMPTEWTTLREANAAVEVGPAGSTQSAGEPRTGGSGGTERTAWSGKHPLHSEGGSG